LQYDNGHDKWLKQAVEKKGLLETKLSKKPTKAEIEAGTKTKDDLEAFAGKYTSANNGRSDFGGWSKAGKDE
jgi:hypothetical protein